MYTVYYTSIRILQLSTRYILYLLVDRSRSSNSSWRSFAWPEDHQGARARSSSSRFVSRAFVKATAKIGQEPRRRTRATIQTNGYGTVGLAVSRNSRRRSTTYVCICPVYITSTRTRAYGIDTYCTCKGRADLRGGKYENVRLWNRSGSVVQAR